MTLVSGVADVEASIQLLQVGNHGKKGQGEPGGSASCLSSTAHGGAPPPLKQAELFANQLLGKWVSVECPADLVGCGRPPFALDAKMTRRFVGVLARMDSNCQMLLSPGETIQMQGTPTWDGPAVCPPLICLSAYLPAYAVHEVLTGADGSRLTKPLPSVVLPGETCTRQVLQPGRFEHIWTALGPRRMNPSC